MMQAGLHDCVQRRDRRPRMRRQITPQILDKFERAGAGIVQHLVEAGNGHLNHLGTCIAHRGDGLIIDQFAVPIVGHDGEQAAQHANARAFQ